MYRNILVATDGSELAARGVEHAATLAAGLGASLTIVTVSEPWNTALTDPSGLVGFDEFLKDYRAAAQARADDVLAAAKQAASRHGVEATTLFVAEQPPADAILETAQARGIDVVVMASHGRRGLGRLLLGSQTQAVVARSELPVLIVR
ncbi:universal stress protein [Luteimonas sp. TWI1416]|uniref:universal stress protein n=1 Tax=unclassified Luteimonas TaxID=2629088 RepID=UPI000B8D9769|nr:universal stress protein UspA [Xanthomonas citri pv. mangiferaeindicae]